MRWKPTVTPSPVSTYITARIARSVALTTLFQSRTIAASVPANGRATAKRLTCFSSLVMAWKAVIILASLLPSVCTNVTKKLLTQVTREPWRAPPRGGADPIGAHLEAPTAEDLPASARGGPEYAPPPAGTLRPH